MGIVSSAMLVFSGVYLALGLVYLRFWMNERTRMSYLAFTTTCISYAIFGWLEFGLMKASTPEQYLSNVWWAFVVGSVGIVAFGWFVYLHLRGRKWLFVTYGGMRLLALVLHLVMANGINFSQVTGVGQRAFLGDTLTYPIAVANPWMLLPHASHLVLVIFALDSSIRCWRRSERRTGWVFGVSTVLFGTATLIIPMSVLWGLVSVPLFSTFFVSFIIAPMLLELNYDMHRAAMAETKAARLGSRLTEIVSNVPGIVWETRTEPRTGRRKTTFISDHVETMLGYSPEEWLKQPPGFGSKIIAEEDRERVLRESEEAVETGKDAVSEFRWIAKDGRVRWIENYLSPIVEDTGIVGLRGVALDVTERKSAEEALRESESFNRTILASLNTHVCVLDRDGRIIAVNQAWATFALENGLTSEMSVGPGVSYLEVCRTAKEGVEFAEVALDGIKAVCDGTSEYFQLEYPCHSPTEKRWFVMTVTPLKGGKGGAVVVHTDITDRKLAAEALVESEARFRNMAESAPMIMWLSDANRAATYVNNKWLELTGGTFDEELGSAWQRHVHPDDLSTMGETVGAAFEKRAPYKAEYRVRRWDGEYRWVLSAGSPRYSADGEFIGYIGTSIDISDRKHAEQKVKEAHDELNKLKDQLQAENIYLQEELRIDQAFGGIIGESSAIKNVLVMVSQVAPTDTTVLITGETGTGKELVARAVHEASKRSDRPLIKVNCAALSPTLIESELFGHEKGAFTGAAARRAGRFELANGGTLLLDEIGELPLDLQGNLLRVLQESEFERVGGTKTVKVDVRVIASTNRDLKQAVKIGMFREDLFYRLNIFPITNPPLRERPDDIPILVEHFATSFARKFGKNLTAVSPEAMRDLCRYSWPGNVRELANVIEREVINLRGTVLRLHEDFSMRKATASAASYETLEELERGHILAVLNELDWRISGPKGAANVLGLNPSTLRTRMDKLGIYRPDPAPLDKIH